MLAQFNIIPCSGKRPLVPWTDFTSRQITDQEYEQWEKLYPEGDRGIVCGPISNLFVLDVDGDDGELSLQGYSLPNTVTVKTPHGRHYYFKWISDLDEKITTRVGVLNKVDVRGEGGFVRFYGWERGPNMAPLLAPPQWLIDLLPNKNGPRVIGESFKKLDYVDALQTLKEGNRNDTFSRLAGGLRSRGFEFKEIYEFLLPKAKEVGFDEKELQTVCQSICRYPAGLRPPKVEVDIPEDFEAFLQEENKVEFLVDRIFARNSIAFIAGLPETCKTWTLVDLALELTKPEGLWLNRFPTKHAKVLYIDQERDKAETQRRFKALMTAKNLDPKEVKKSIRVKTRTNSPFRINLPESFEKFHALLKSEKPDVVLIDSYKTFHTCEINSHTEMQRVMELVKSLVTEFSCTFVFVYHENKAAFERLGADRKPKQVTFEYMAGASVMSEVAETILITVKSGQDSSFIHHVKNSYGQKVAPVLASVENLNPERTKIQVIAR